MIFLSLLLVLYETFPGSIALVLKHTLLLKTRRTFSAGSFAGFRKSSAAPRVFDVLSAKASSRRSSRSAVRAQQQQQVPSDTEPGWDKLSSDDFDTWMDNGGPSTPLLVRPQPVQTSLLDNKQKKVPQPPPECSCDTACHAAGYCELSGAPEELQSQPAQAALQGAALRHCAHRVQDWGCEDCTSLHQCVIMLSLP